MSNILKFNEFLGESIKNDINVPIKSTSIVFKKGEIENYDGDERLSKDSYFLKIEDINGKIYYTKLKMDKKSHNITPHFDDMDDSGQ